MEETTITSETLEVSDVSSTETVEDNATINNRTVRFSDAPWYKPGTMVIVGGAGSIGSWLSLGLSRQEAKIQLFDYDMIDEVNMAGQMYSTSDIGKNKADVMVDQCMAFSANGDVVSMGKYEEDSFSNDFVFSAFDNMAARKLMFEKWVEFVTSEDMKGKPAIFIDGRLTAEEMQIYAVTRKDIDNYRKYLWDDKDVPDVACSFKSTTHSSMTIAGFMTAIFNNYITNVHYKAQVREVPFRTSLEFPTMMFNTKENEPKSS